MAINTLVSVFRITIVANFFMLGSEVFTAFYTGGAHATAVRYLFLGEHGKHGLVPWIWTAIGLNALALVLLVVHKRTRHLRYLNVACACAFGGVWIEKGMGLIVPGFVPSTLHELVEYSPSLTEWKVTAGVWAFGFAVLTIGLKVALPVLTGRIRLEPKGARDVERAP